MFFGFIILIVGVVFLLENLGIISGGVWTILWPCLVIAVGLGIVWKRKKREDRWEKFGDGMRKFGEKMGEKFGEREKEK